MTVLLFLVVLVLLILVHEWGHFIVAKKTGMRVDEFGIGLPPKLFGYKKGETEYTLNALPIGGFVRILGENGDSEEMGEATLSDADRARTFSARPKWAQALVLVAGVTMNILFAWFLFTIALMVGVPEVADENTPAGDASLVVVSVVADSPAGEAGIPVGVTITEVKTADETLQTLTPTSFRDFIVAHGDETVTVTYEKGGAVESRELLATTGLISDDAERPAVGVTLSYTTIAREPLHLALYHGAESTIHTFGAITVGLGGLIYETFAGTADYSQVAGPVGIAGLVGDAAEFGFTSLMIFTAVISLNLAVINLLPFPALDGGRLVFVAIEAVTRRDIPPVWTMRVNLVGFALLMLLMVLVTYSDVSKLL